MRKVLLGILLLVLGIALFYKSPFSAMYNFNKAKELYQSSNYEQSLPYFERALFASPKDSLMRYTYVLALSKAKPVYSVQKKLYAIANSEPQDEAAKTARAKVLALKFKLLSEFKNNYISNAVYGNDILRWDIKSFPLRVYFENPDDVPAYYVNNINKALQVWTSKTNFVKFTQAKDMQNADIIVSFKDIPQDVCSGNVCNYAVAYTEPEVSGKSLLKRMHLTFYKTNPKNDRFLESEIFNTAQHEIGHTLGIMGHSSFPMDLMYSEKDNDSNYFPSLTTQHLSRRDLNTLVLLYRIEPTITNTPNLTSETFYYAPLIIGEEDERVQQKITEYTNYIRKYPNLASGYINLASSYADYGDFEKAMNLLIKGSAYAKSNDEKFLIEYNKAAVYFNQQKYAEALNAANNAKSIKDDNSVNDLIHEIQSIMGNEG